MESFECRDSPLCCGGQFSERLDSLSRVFVIPVIPDPGEHAGRAEKIAVVRDAPVDSLPFHVLSAVVAQAAALMSFSCGQRMFHCVSLVRVSVLTS